MIDRTNADTYFFNHAKTAEWFGFSEDSREGAISAARRILARGLGRAMDDNEAEYIEGDQGRDEYAVYEQALHCIQTARVADPTVGTPYPVAMPSQQEINVPTRALYSPEALKWLGAVNTARTIRGD